MVGCCDSFQRQVQKGISAFFEYDTPKIVHIRSKRIGILNRLIQLVVIGYIIGWVLIYRSGYQQEDIGIPGTTTKVKGVATTNFTDPREGRKLWDTQDIVIPAEENNAFFVTTNAIVTRGQKQGVCAEDSGIPGAQCEDDHDCPEGKRYLLGHGVNTGTCNTTTHTCMVLAWCPIENDTLVDPNEPILRGTDEFTVLVKNHVYFPFYQKTRSNILESTNKTYLKNCTYDTIHDPFCPVFTLGYIVQEALKKLDKPVTYNHLALEGGVISIKISWNCNFDYDPKECKPAYDFDRLDKGDDSVIARGYNFRYGSVFSNLDGEETRELTKAYGILFIITVDARARAFNVIPTFQNIGSGIALLAIATVLCDIFVLHLHKRRAFFQLKKYEDVKTPDAYEIMERPHAAHSDNDIFADDDDDSVLT